MSTLLSSLDKIISNPPQTMYPVRFVSNRALKSFSEIQDQIIPRTRTDEYPKESFIVNFQKMASEDCHALVYIRGEAEKYTNPYNNRVSYHSRTNGRSVVAWYPYNSDGTMTDLGQVTVSDPKELEDFAKVINWVWHFLAEYKKERHND